MKIKIIPLPTIFLLIVASYGIFKYHNSTNLYFICSEGERGSETETIDDKKQFTFSTSIDLEVKKYFFGILYTINNYEKKECNISDDELLCMKDESHVSLNIATGKVDILETTKIGEKQIWNRLLFER